MIKSKLTYLAAPYSAVATDLVEQRMEKVAQAQAQLVSRGFFPVTPLSCHWIKQHGDWPVDWNFWQHYSRALLEQCDKFVIVDLDGWETSEGVQAELRYARSLGLDCFLYDVVTSELRQI